MKTPHRKLITLAVLLTLVSPSFAEEFFVGLSDIEKMALQNRNDQLFYFDQTSDPYKTNRVILVADRPIKLHYSPTDSSSLVDFTAIYSEGEIVFQNNPNIIVETKGMNSSKGVSADGSIVSADSLSIEIQSLNGESTALSFAYSETHNPLKFLKLKASAENEAIALLLESSKLSVTGQFELIAKSNTPNTWALKAFKSDIELTSKGNSSIEGNIYVDESSNVSLVLQNPTDKWFGRTDGGIGKGFLQFTNASGAVWETNNTSYLKQWTWGDGGVLDIRNQDAEVRIESNQTLIKNGAILKIDLANNIINSEASNLFISGINNTGNVEVLVYAENSSELSLLNTDGYTITLKGSGKDFVSLVPAETVTENALYTVSTTPIIGNDGTAWVISGLQSEIKGTSTLMNQQLDFFGTNTIAHEQMTDRSVARALDRAILNQKHNGHWVDVTYSETDLHFNDGNRHQTLKTTGFEMGYDRQVTLPSLTDSVFTVSAQVAQNDVTIDRGDGEIDQWGFNVYAGGITENNYRVLLGGHYQQGKAELTSFAYLGNQKANFDFDREVWAASAYLGFVKSTFADSNWHIEPFMSGTAYWIKTNDSQNLGITIASEKLQQSVVRLGATVGYRSETIPVTWTAKGAWAHRFGRSVTMTGQTNNMTGEFATEDLKESWGELALEGRWDNQRGFSVSARAQMAKSHDVEPQFEVGLNAKFRF